LLRCLTAKVNVAYALAANSEAFAPPPEQFHAEIALEFKPAAWRFNFTGTARFCKHQRPDARFD
jgi:hypothetical protein